MGILGNKEPDGTKVFQRDLYAGCSCDATRRAHTMSVAGFADFWVIFIVGLFLETGGLLCCGVCVFSWYFRRELRKQRGIEPNVWSDCFVSFFCLPCAQCQEALEVDDASGVAVMCCCDLQGPQAVAQAAAPSPSVGTIVGQPVAE